MEKENIKEKLVYIKELLIKLDKRIIKFETEHDEEERETLFAAMTKFVEEIIEKSIKINMLLLENKNDFASTYYQSVSKLSKYYKLTKEDELYFSKLTSLRNKATHEYENITSNQEKIFQEYKLLVKNYPRYISFVQSCIE